MPPKDSIFCPSEVFLRNADGTVTPLGEADIAGGELQLCETETTRWWTPGGETTHEFACSLQGLTTTEVKRFLADVMFRDLIQVIREFRRQGHRGRFHFELREQEYLGLRAASRLFGMNPTRYIRSVIPSAPARLFLVHLRTGYRVWRK